MKIKKRYELWYKKPSDIKMSSRWAELESIIKQLRGFINLREKDFINDEQFLFFIDSFTDDLENCGLDDVFKTK